MRSSRVLPKTINWIHYPPREFLSYIVHSVTLTQSWVYKIVVNQRVLWNNGFGLAWSLSCERAAVICEQS